jgi:hypothetical protein
MREAGNSKAFMFGAMRHAPPEFALTQKDSSCNPSRRLCWHALRRQLRSRLRIRLMLRHQ